MVKNKPTLTRIMSAYHTKITRGRRWARVVLIDTNSSGGSRAYSGRSAGGDSMMLEQRSDRQRLAGRLMCGAREQSADCPRKCLAIYCRERVNRSTMFTQRPIFLI